MTAKLRAMLTLMRPLQWTKNIFVLAPLIFSKNLLHADAIGRSLAAFIVFVLISSFLYIANDWRDVASDRQHPKKRHRPLAAGTVTKPEAALLLLALAGATAALLALLRPGWAFVGVAGLYAGVSLSYTLGLKHVQLLELFIVAAGYVLRVIAGSIVLAVEPSPWILAASGLVAFLITAGKRRADMADNLDPDNNRRSLAGYTVGYLDHIIAIAAGMTILTYILFTASDYAATRFHSPYLIGTSVFVAFGVLRYLQLIMVGNGADDPTSLIVRDPPLLASVVLWGLSIFVVVYLL
jgi:4-hydroxybenzoate polyprenyltransferase